MGTNDPKFEIPYLGLSIYPIKPSFTLSPGYNPKIITIRINDKNTAKSVDIDESMALELIAICQIALRKPIDELRKTALGETES